MKPIEKLYLALVILFIIAVFVSQVKAKEIDEIKYVISEMRRQISSSELNLLSEAILSRCKKWEIGYHWVLAMMSVESDFRNIVGITGDIGYMQVNPITAQWVCFRLGVPYSEKRLFEAAYNLDIALFYFRYCLEYYVSCEEITNEFMFVNLYLATIAYNAGMNFNSTPAAPLPKEYLQKVLDRYEKIQELIKKKFNTNRSPP